jgi:acyl-CoA reductase-like NAD-dependent aldehyde dehydrogenase
METKKFLVGGTWRTSDATLDVVFPYTGETVEKIYGAGEEDIEAAITAAQRGFAKTRALPAYARAEILHRLRELMAQHADDLVEAMILEGGKTRNVAEGELARAQETIHISAEEAKRFDDEVVPMDWTPAGEGRFAVARRFPLGVVLGITPFNYPLNLACHKLGPAIAAGNAFILKPAPETPLSSLLLGELVLEAGYPPEALSVLLPTDAMAEQMVRDPRIAYLTFTGSTEVGWHLKQVAGRKRVGLELGGNAAVILHEDANVDYALRRIAVGGFTNAGQNCISVQRVLVHRSLYDDVLARLIERVQQIKVGDPRDPETRVGPMIHPAAAERAMRWVEEAVDQDAQIVLGGTREGTMFQPTILTDVRPEMKVSCQEIFAPVVTVTPYDTFEEAIALANKTDYGLQGGVFTQDINRILYAYEHMEVGGLQINDVSTFRVDQMPYGGVKGSGVGREGPKYAIEEMTEVKLMVINQPGGRL